MDSKKLDLDFLIQEHTNKYSNGSLKNIENSILQFDESDGQKEDEEHVDISLLFSDKNIIDKTESDIQFEPGGVSEIELPAEKEKHQELLALEFDINEEAVDSLNELDFESECEEEDLLNIVLENTTDDTGLTYDAPGQDRSDDSENVSQEYNEFDFLIEEMEDSLILPEEHQQIDQEKGKADLPDNTAIDQNALDFQIDDSESQKVNLKQESDDLYALLENLEDPVDRSDRQNDTKEEHECSTDQNHLSMESEIILPDDDFSNLTIKREPKESKEQSTPLDSGESDDEPFILSNRLESKPENEECEPVRSTRQPKTPSHKAFYDSSDKKNFLTSSMSLSSLFENTKLLGLDIGETSLKYVILKKTARGIKLVDCGMHAISEKLINVNEDEKREIITEILQKNFKINARKNTLITSAISGLEVLYHNVQVPKLAKKDLSKSVPWACRKDFPFPIENTIFEFQIVENQVKNSENKLHVFVQAAQKELVSRHLELLTNAKIVPAKISTIPVALWNVFGILVKKNAEKCYAIIDIGGVSSHIVFVHHRQLQFAREISTAGDDITGALTGSIFINGEEITITREKAEAIKRKYGFLNNFKDDDKEGNIPLKEISVMMGPVLERLVKEIQRTIDFYREKFHVDNLEKIFLTGGGTFLHNLTSFLESELNSEVEILNPFQIISTKNFINQQDLFNLGPRFAVALGLALDKKKELNFLPEELKGAQTYQYFKRIYRYLLVITILTMLLLSQNVKLQIKKLQNELKDIKTNYELVKPKRMKFLALQKTLSDLTKKNAIYKKKIDDNLNYSKHLKVISHLIPSNIALTAFKVNHRNDKTTERTQELVILEGVAFQNNSMEGINLAKFLLALEKSNYFNSVSLKSQTIRQDGNLEFTIECVI